MPRLREYSFQRLSGEIVGEEAIEDGDVYAVGYVYGREGIPDGMTVRTSIIRELNSDGSIKTQSGTTYILETVSKEYIEFLQIKVEDEFPVIDEPVKMFFL